MSKVLQAAIEFTAATNRWSAGGANSIYMTTGTIWYGMMCRAFLVLERLLRSCIEELSKVDENLAAESRRRRGAGKPLNSLTMGQCLGVLEDLAPTLGSLLSENYPEIAMESEMFPAADREAWGRILALRNRMVHHGPGFFDSVDYFSGRIWRSYEIDEPLHQQAQDVWRVGRELCRSAAVLTCIALQNVSAADALRALAQAESVQLELSEISASGNQAIEDLHASSGKT